MRPTIEITERRLFRPGVPLIMLGIWLAIIGSFEIVKSVTGFGGITICIFRNVTGQPCPTCGATRTAKSIVSGDVVGAFLLNPLVFSGMVVLAGWLIMRVGFRRRLVLGLSRRERVAAWVLFILMLAANWGYVIARDGTIFTPAP